VVVKEDKFPTPQELVEEAVAVRQAEVLHNQAERLEALERLVKVITAEALQLGVETKTVPVVVVLEPPPQTLA
jgi:hypothetical protein